jgi:hypothetical protein
MMTDASRQRGIRSGGFAKYRRIEVKNEAAPRPIRAGAFGIVEQANQNG